MSDEQWYYSLRTHQVVRGDQEKAADRLGPYATREEAAQALARVEANNERNDAIDKAERDDEQE